MTNADLQRRRDQVMAQREAIAADTTIAGYHLRSSRDGSFVYLAVSDIPETDLAAFERAFIAEARQL